MLIIKKYQDAKPELVGAKAANLFRLKDRYAVPEFVVISSEGFESYRARKAIDDTMKKELSGILEQFFKDGLVAVRSSCTAEDLPGVSFAGIYATTLNISNVEQGLKAIVKTLNSVDSERAVSYCRKMKIRSGKMAVIIQHQLNPELAGIMVTQSPFSVSETLIEYCTGLGDRVVSGAVEPSRYRVAGGRIIEHRGPIPMEEDVLLELVKIGKDVENMFGTPQDIEWALQNGRIYLLQSRPVMITASMPRRKCTVWCNVNVRETIPDPVSPLMWSLFDDVFFPMIILDTFGIPLSIEQFKKFPPVENLSGRLYWNLNNTIAYGAAIGPVLDFMGANKNLDPQLATALQALDVKNLPKPMGHAQARWFSLSALFKIVNFTLRNFCCYTSFPRKIVRTNKAFEEHYQKTKFSEDLKAGLENAKNLMTEPLLLFCRSYFSGIFLSIVYLIILQRLFSLRMGRTGAAIARKAITGLIDKTGEMAMAMDDLALLARQKLGAANVVKIKRLYQDDAVFKQRFDDFMVEYGHRGPAEFDISSLNWREDPDLVFNLLAAPRDKISFAKKRQEIIAELLKSLKPVERTILKIFLPRLEAFVPMRENGKHIFFKMLFLMKQQLLLISRKLVERGYLTRERDIFLLYWNELEDLTGGRIAKDKVLRLIEKRKDEQEIFRNAPVPDIIYESGERLTAMVDKADLLKGEALSFGTVKAKARVIRAFKESDKLKKGEILVTHHADPGWTPLFTIASGVVIEVGGLICHAAMVARELGIPAVVIKGATKIIPDGAMVELDADLGRVIIVP